ncbi:hypothetical protein HK405_002767 [Cladochytrium tenue]|nr:hypothetical protein HK405_002767 [Cladochytrium tenue]
MDGQRLRACGSVCEDRDGRWAFARWSNLILGVVYLEPSAPRDVWNALVQERDRISRRFPTAPMIVVGDFNCRMRDLGDHENGPRDRREWLSNNWLDDPDWHRIAPDRGVYTTHHAALTFRFDQRSLNTSKPFSRLNVRKLCKEKEKFAQALSEHVETLQEELSDIENRVYELAEEGVSLSFADRTAVVNVANDIICDTVLSTARQVAGVTHFRGGLAGPQLEEEHVRHIARLREDAIARAEAERRRGQDPTVPHLEARQFTSALRKAQRPNGYAPT